LQLTPAACARPSKLAEERKALKPLTDEAKTLNGDFDQLMRESQRRPMLIELQKVPGLEDSPLSVRGRLSNARIPRSSMPWRRPMRTKRRSKRSKSAKPAAKKSSLAGNSLQGTRREVRSTDRRQSGCESGGDRPRENLKALGDNRDAQEPFSKKVKVVGDHVQLTRKWAFVGRIALALLIIAGVGRRLLLRMAADSLA